MKISRLVCVVIALLPCAALAGSFDGTWKLDATHANLSKKPLVLNLTGNTFSCSSCVPATPVTADGTDQKLDGGTFDALAITVVGPNEVDVVRKLQGKTLLTIKQMVSSDGNTLTREGTDSSGTAPMKWTLLMKRVAPAPAGAHAISGSWVETKLESVSDAGSLETLADTDDGFSVSANGQGYDAKFDGKKVPQKDDPTHTMVSVKRVGPNEIVETDYRKGKTVEVIHFTVSADGKTISVVDTDVQEHSTDRYKLLKQ